MLRYKEQLYLFVLIIIIVFTSAGHEAKSASLSAAPAIIPNIGHSDRIYDLAISPDEKLLISVSQDNTIKIWDLSNRTLVRTLESHVEGIIGISFIRAGAQFISVSRDGKIHRWDSNTFTVIEIYQIQVKETDSSIQSMSKSFDDRHVLLGLNGRVLSVMIDATNGRIVKKYYTNKFSGLTTSVAITTDKKYVVAGTQGGTIFIWDVRGERSIRQIQAHKDRKKKFFDLIVKANIGIGLPP